MNILKRLFTSTLGKKYLMAITGAGLFLFVVGHMVGNLQVFLGPEAINRYAHFLQSNVELLWPVRIGLLAFVAIHLWTSISLTLENYAARGVSYEEQKLVRASLASRTMIWTGIIIAVFVIFHLLHYTVRVEAVNLEGKDFKLFKETIGGETRHDVYRMMIVGFSNKWVSLFYLIGVGLLCFHLSHGVSAMFQSLGLKNEVNAKCIDRLAAAAAIVIFLGYISIPFAVCFGLVK